MAYCKKIWSGGNVYRKARIYLDGSEQHFERIFLLSLLLRVRHYYRCLQLLYKVNVSISHQFHIVDLAQDISTATNTEHCCLVFQTWLEEETLCLHHSSHIIKTQGESPEETLLTNMDLSLLCT